MAPETVRAVVDAFWRDVFPVAVNCVTEVVASVDVPVTPSVPEAMRDEVAVTVPAVMALVVRPEMLRLVAVKFEIVVVARVETPETVKFVVEAFPSVVCPVAVNCVTVVVASEEMPVTPSVPPIVSFPVSASEVALIAVAVRADVVVVARIEVPETVSADVEAFASDV